MRLFTALLFLPLLLSAQVQVFNAGIGGHNTRNGVKRIHSLLAQYKPTILVIGFGANDAVNSVLSFLKKSSEKTFQI